MKQEKINYEGRKIRGYAILSKGDEPEHIGKGVYRIPSQSGNGIYLVTSRYGKYECMCLDYMTRKIECKHIHAIKFWLELKKKIDKRETLEIPKLKEENNCVYCKSENIVKFGKIKGSEKQRFQCKSCKKTFVAEKDFRKFKGNPKIITAVLDLYFKGVSLRKIQDHAKQFYNIEITHVTIYYWIKRFTKIMNDYVNTLDPQVSGMWNTDEQMVKIKKKDQWAYCWNIIDNETRFLIANNITQERSTGETRQIFKKAKETKVRQPDIIITDGLQSYKKAIRKEFSSWQYPKTRHIHSTGIAKNPNNNKVERFHNTFRERDKVIRGFQNNETAQEWADAFRLYYNYIKPHSTFNGLTPSEVAGIRLNLKENRWLELLKLSLEKKNKLSLENGC